MNFADQLLSTMMPIILYHLKISNNNSNWISLPEPYHLNSVHLSHSSQVWTILFWIINNICDTLMCHLQLPFISLNCRINHVCWDRGEGVTQIWFRRGCATQASKHKPIFKGLLWQKKAKFSGIFLKQGPFFHNFHHSKFFWNFEKQTHV